MASRSMQYLRKNAKPVMVVMGIVCMITFGLGAAVLDIFSNRGSRAENRDPVALTWTKGAVREGQLNTWRMRHVAAVEFLGSVIGETLQRGGHPVVNGQAISDEFTLRRTGIGISTDSSDQSLVETMLLAEEARRMGIVVDRDAVKAHLKQLSSPELSEREWGELMERILEHRPMSADDVLDHLAFELQAQHARNLTVDRALRRESIPPGQMWEYFNRLNRRMSIEALPLDVEPFVANVKSEPTAVEMQKLFDEGRFRDPNPNSHEPGFRKPHKVAFEYVRVDFQPFLEAAEKDVTEEQIKKRYEENIAQGKHKVLELSPAGTPPATPGTTPGEKKEGEAKEGEKKEGEQPAETKPAETKPAETKPAETKPSEAKPAETKPADANKPADKAGEAKPAEKTDNTAEKKADEPPGGDCQDKAGEAKSDQAKPVEKPSEAKPDTKPAEAKPPEAKPGEAPPEAKPGETKPAEAKPAEGKPGEVKPSEPPMPKFKPLEEVKDEIRKELAQAPAQDARNKAVEEVTKAINNYGNKYRPWIAKKEATQGKVDLSKSDPGKFNLAEVAAKHGFKTGVVPLSDQFEVAKTDIGQHVSMLDFAALQQAGQVRYLRFADLAYGLDQPLYSAQEANSDEAQVTYLYYRTGEEKGSEVKLAEVKDQIVAAWKHQKAFELAVADAKALAAKVQTSAAGKPLTEPGVVPDPAKVVAPPAFSWMTTGATGFGFGMPEPSRVTGIDLTGREFMQAVFALQPGEVGAAPNEAHSVVYVVRLVSQEPSEALLRTQFMESGMSGPVQMVAQSDAMRTIYEWYRGIEERYQVKWQRPPFDNRRGG